MAEPTSPTTFPLDGDELTNLVMQRLRANFQTLLPMTPVIVEFCDVKLASIGNWFVDPTAKSLGGTWTLKLWHFQQQAGIDCPELDAASAARPYGAAVGKLLAFSVINTEEARALCGGVKDGAVLRAARGGRVMSPRLTLAELQQKYGADLQAALETLQEQLGEHRAANQQLVAVPAPVPMVASSTKPSRAARQPDPTNDPLAGVSRDELVELIITRLGLTPEVVSDKIATRTAESMPPQQGASRRPAQHELVRDIAASLVKAYTDANYAFAELTAEEQAFLRRLVGEDTLFNLKNVLAALCGSRAHQLTQGD